MRRKPDPDEEPLSDRVKRGVGDALARVSTMAGLAELRRRIARLETHSHGARATYVGNNRVLVKIVVRDRPLAYLVPADDLLLSPWFIVTGHFEQTLTDFFVPRLAPDSRCIDVGANFGFFTCLMARFAPQGRVAGIEPDGRMRDLVRDNIAINHLTNATAIEAAAGAADGELTLYRRSTRPGNTSIVRADASFTDMMGEAPAEPFAVRGIRIDDLVATEFDGRVDFLKIDVEGAEPLVFDGMRQTIARNPQLQIVMEWSPGQIVGAGFDLGDFLRRLERDGLRPFDLMSRRRGPKLVPLSYAELADLPYRAGIVLRR